MKSPFILRKDIEKGFDFSPWGGIEGYLKATSNGANATKRSVALKRLVPSLSKAVAMTATAVSMLPFEIRKGDKIIDESQDWQDKLGGLPDPRKKFYLIASSLCGGEAYLLPTMTGKRIVDLQYLVPHSITPQINIDGLQYFERNTDEGKSQKLGVDEIIYFWLPDSDVEIGPALDTPLSNAITDSEILLSTSNTMKMYGDRGYVPITVLGAKGMPSGGEKEKAEGFFNRLLTNGFEVLAKVINAEALSIEKVGAGLDELKGVHVEIRDEAKEAIGEAFGIPPGIFMKDAAFASEYVALIKTWYESSRFRSIYHTIEGVFNEQVFSAFDAKLLFNVQALDVFQEDEKERTAALFNFSNAVQINPLAAHIGMDFLGFDLSDEQQKKMDAIIVAEEKEKDERQQAMIESIKQGGGGGGNKLVAEAKKEDADLEKQRRPKAVLTPEEIKDLNLWHQRAKAWFKKGKSAADWRNRCLPEEVAAPIRIKLAEAESEEDIHKAFTIEAGEDYGLLTLAEAINKAANVPQFTNITHNHIPESNTNITAQIPEKTVTVVVPEQEPPIVNVDVAAPQVDNVVNVESNKPDETDDVLKAVRKLANAKK